jgi:large exoprotein involved in heme utilization and adhesion
VILDSSQILANADAGTGGNINITAGHFIASADSLVDASANTGIDGNVNIDTPDEDISGSLVDLPESFLDAVALLKQRCAARAGGSASSFVVTGPGGLPAAPDSLLYANAYPQADLAPDTQHVSQLTVRTGTANDPVLMLACGN